MAAIIAIANHKGGTGKTATTHTLGVHFAEGGYRVLLLDVDAQGSLTLSCGVKNAAGRSLAEVLSEESGALALADVIQPIGPCLDLAPADVKLSAVELMLMRRQEINSIKVALAPVAHRYDLILIDCAPSRGVLMLNALAAAHGVICPTRTTIQDLGGLRLLITDTLARVRQSINPALAVVGILPTFYNGRTIHHRETLAALRKGGLPILSPIGESIRVAEAPAFGETVLTYAPDNPQAYAYRKLGREVEQWLESVQARHQKTQ